jgi:1-acyl-sn-glycerol-3-phosphate acyltransferase
MTKESLYLPAKSEQKALLTAWNVFFWGLAGVSSFPVEVRYPERAPGGPHVVAANHRGLFEIPAMLNVYTREGLGWILFMSKKENFEKDGINWLFRHAGAFPVDRENPGTQQIRTAIRYLQAGWNVGIMPEGTRGSGETLTQFKEFHGGAVFIAQMAKVPILPVVVVGSEKILAEVDKMSPKQIIGEFKKMRKTKPKPQMRMAFGESLPWDMGDRVKMTAQLRSDMEKLITELED